MVTHDTATLQDHTHGTACYFKRFFGSRWYILMQCFSALTLLVGRQEGHLACKNRVVGCWRGCLGWGADLHIAQQMPLPLTFPCSSKSRLVLTFLVLPFWCLLTRVDPDIFQTSSKTVVCVYVCCSLLHVCGTSQTMDDTKTGWDHCARAPGSCHPSKCPFL